MARRLLASALPWRCFPAARRQLQHPRPTADPSIPPVAKNISQTPSPPPCRESVCEYSVPRKHIGRPEREILVLVYGYYDFPNPSVYHDFPKPRLLLIPRIANVGTSFSPLPSQAWHGYMVTNAHRVVVEVGTDGVASAPPSGAAAGRHMA
jgi:hypothetical protein